MGSHPIDLPNRIISHVRSIKRSFNSSLLRWWRENGRNYPWRVPEVTPYMILLAEVLLKRTTATAAEKSYRGLLKKHPDIHSLAKADPIKLEDLLSAVGLQKQRAKGLKEIAQYIRDKEAGEIPRDLQRLLKIPHIGPYTARAILSFAFDAPHAVVDSNVVRVLKCVFKGIIPEKADLRMFQSVVDVLVPRNYHREFNWALLDLGATRCHYSRQVCKECPLKRLCKTHALN